MMIPKVRRTTTTFMAGVSLAQKTTVSFASSRPPQTEVRKKIPFCRENVVLVQNCLY
jgi:hypothetical protein